MPATRVAISSVTQDPDREGVWLIKVHTFGADEVDVVVSEDEAVRLVRTLQQGFLDRRVNRTETPTYPSLTVVGVDMAHGVKTSGLLLQTTEIGSVVLAFDSSVAPRFKSEIDRLEAAKSARRAPS